MTVVPNPDPVGFTTTPFGLCNSDGFSDANGDSARFFYPQDVKFINSDMAVVADAYNHKIRFLDLTNNYAVTSVGASSYGNTGHVDGAGTSAKFNMPHGVCVNADGSIVYVADKHNNKIRTITVSTNYVGTLSMSESKAWLGCVVAGDRIIATDYTAIYEIEIETGDIVKTYADTAQVKKVSVSHDLDTIFFADNGYHSGYQIWKIPRSGDTKILVAGTPNSGSNTAVVDGTIDQATFWNSWSIVVSKDGNTLYVSQTNNLRKIDLAAGVVTTIAGPLTNDGGCTTNTDGTSARFGSLRGMDISSDGSYLLIAD